MNAAAGCVVLACLSISLFALAMVWRSAHRTLLIPHAAVLVALTLWGFATDLTDAGPWPLVTLAAGLASAVVYRFRYARDRRALGQ